MKERKPLMKKENNLKYVILIVFIVLALGYVAYDKSNINIKDMKIFEKKDKQVNQITVASNSTGMGDTIETFSSSGSLRLLFAVCAFGLAVAAFILPLFRGIGGEGL